MEEKKQATIGELLDALITDDSADDLIKQIGNIKAEVSKLENERDDAIEKYHETRHKYIHAIQNGDFGTAEPEDNTDQDGPVTMEELIEKYSKEGG